ncbi:3,4-dihydroxy-2-butanone-4-phosphate synthase [Ruania alba]|uniref:Multifunctional fusion protein n=1 Tax=Ruania alba TaxID=648782 RepID=A0A1H5MKB1_9MICO|nr:3,4-dihydroxy-2-butanone-4-phosphate synthase [Ruania alba]SEE89157.1 3,4-dihydroxy 2-butanone 4-phosphate synthase / GTP cyclohydrolase II [Ruania alba]
MRDVERAIAEIAAGRTVIVVDDADRENEGDLVAAADAITPETVAFMATYGRGLICAPITAEDAGRLDLPPMVARNTEAHGTAFTVSVDATEGISTGISAADRAHTLRLLADPATAPEQLARPGHVFPLVAHPDGVLGRIGHTEAGVDLTRLAGRRPAAVICEMLTPDGVPCRGEELRAFAAENGMALVTVAELVAYRQGLASSDGEPIGWPPVVEDATDLRTPIPPATVRRQAEATLPIAAGTFRAITYLDQGTGTEHVALCLGLNGSGHFSGEDDVLVRVHSECLTGEAFGSLRCDCGPQLDDALTAIAAEGRGVVVYLRGHEGRGTGLTAKIRAYQLQEQGRDTVEANLDQGLPADARDYAAAAAILLDLGAREVRLKSNNPAKSAALAMGGVAVRGHVSAPAPVGVDNLAYLRTKATRMGHVLPWLPDEPHTLTAPTTHERTPV